mgnify:FL=1
MNESEQSGDWYCKDCGYIECATFSETCSHCHQPLEWHTVSEQTLIEQLQRERDGLKEIADMYREGIEQLEHGIMSTGVRKHRNKLLDSDSTIRAKEG